MLDKRKFTISIGDYGVIVALHNGNNIQNKILVAALNDENKPKLKDLFNEHKSAPIYVLIDSADQNYKRKSYPPVSSFDFHKITKRDFGKEVPYIDKAFQSYYGYKDKLQKKWECVFVSTPHPEELEKWNEFLLELPNQFVGIYMLPVETYCFAERVFNLIKTEHNLQNNENNVLSFIFQNKISGVRQVAFSNNAIIFTRVVNYDFEDENFPNKFEQDIFRANEYLKMIFPKLRSQDVVIVNILSDEITSKIKNLENGELRFINYSPFQIAAKLGISNAIAKNNSNFSDIIVANSFAQNKKKTLRFSNPAINLLTKLDLTIKAILGLNCAITAAILFMLTTNGIESYRHNDQMSQLKSQKLQLEQQLQAISNAALDSDIKTNPIKTSPNKADNDLANEIIDFGKIDEALSASSVNLNEMFNRLSFIKKFGALVSSFSYQLPNHNSKSNTFSVTRKFSLSGDLSDSSGDIEALFRKFDSLNLETKNKLSEYNVKYSEMSKNIDFGKKYYSVPFDLTIENKASGYANAK